MGPDSTSVENHFSKLFLIEGDDRTEHLARSISLNYNKDIPNNKSHKEMTIEVKINTSAATLTLIQ